MVSTRMEGKRKKLEDLLKPYQEHPKLSAFAAQVKASEHGKFQVKGLAGSQFAMISAALYRLTQRSIVILVNDKEEALYVHNDLKSIMPKKEILLFPASYKRPYQIEEIDNANILQRAEVLNKLNHIKTGRQVVVTFAEALNEKVINRKSLVKNTHEIEVGADLGMDFLVDVLDDYGFEREDYVFQPGQYAIRGGILDVFSFAKDVPYRIEFFGDEIDSIRTFDPVEQTSQEKVKRISLIPNVQRSLILEEKVSFLEYLSPTSIFLTKNIDFINTDLQRMFEKAESKFQELMSASGGGASSLEPKDMYFSGDAFRTEIRGFTVVECNQQPWFNLREADLSWQGSGQPAFHKEFHLLAEHLKENQSKGLTNYIVTENEKQIDRLEEIFEEVDQEVRFEGIIGDLHEGYKDDQTQMACYTDHQIFDRYHRYKSKSSTKRSQAITLQELRELRPGDYVVHVHHGIGKFAGLHTIQVGTHTQEAAKIMYKNGDAIFVNVNSLHKISKYSGKEGAAPKLSKLGSPAWAKAKAKTKSRVKELAFDLVSLYAKRKTSIGFSFETDGYLQQELEASFMFEDTPDQVKTTEEVKVDMEKPYPMDRLVCGDVGFGKTEIAIRAAFKAAVAGKQTAVLVPTTILALQHYKTFMKRLREFPVEVDYINRFKSRAQVNDTLSRVASGEVDILIGTHRLVSKDVNFKDLGLMIIDEEQRFGVNVKDKLKLMKENVDALTLTATPIPRTLQFSLAGIRDLSVITTPPPNRQPIETVVTTFDPITLRDAVTYELKRGGQVFFIHPRVKDIEEVASSIKKLVPDARIRIAHGQMTGPKLEEIMVDFIEGGFDILVATTIIESGLDIPNANTIIINEANKYGLSELHQMRGRVGRSNRKAFCYLVAPPEISQTQDARKRLKAMEEFSDLGSGFHIALRDLDIRGAGDLLGGEQSGFISEIGYDMYHRILDEAVKELKEEHFADLFEDEIKERKKVIVEDVKIDLDLDIRLPEMYVPSIPERLKFYRRIAGATKEEDLRDIQRQMIDRFGPMPGPVLALFDATRIRETAARVGVERVVLKGDILRFYFVANQDSPFFQSKQFMRVIEYVQTFSARVKLKESPKFLSLIYQEVKDIKRVLTLIQELHDFVMLEPSGTDELS
ncbi:transcription-repair coupling factor [Pontibacter sp. G13]|uniref:transcription-repair coupling factor n=1 Tax=Pontibacter sp. G13 TaxID=3074898 RepID=UPI0028899895|nr:transcription-repair coupling factor [Pontibacter sp. G13]WNJ18548.1 transcription-repair coupling factor [Pontibacter sp. G13]